MASAATWMEMPVYAACRGLSRTNRIAGKPAFAASSFEHARSQEPLADADQKHDTGNIQAALVGGDIAGCGGNSGLCVARVYVPSRVSICGAQFPAFFAEAAANHGSAAG